MQHFTADALILRAEERGEHDQLLTVLAADYGRFYAILKGAHSYRREIAATEPYTWSNVEFYERGGIKWVKNAAALETFPALRKDPEKLFLAAYVCEVASALSDEREPAGEILQLTLNTLYMLAAGNDADRIKAAFEMRAAAISGYEPALGACARCGAPVGELVYLDVMNGALLCPACLKKAAALAPLPEVNDLGERNILVPLTAAAARALAYVCTAAPKRVFAFELKDTASLAAFSRAGETYLLHHLERGFASLDNLKRLRAMRPHPAT